VDFWKSVHAYGMDFGTRICCKTKTFSFLSGLKRSPEAFLVHGKVLAEYVVLESRGCPWRGRETIDFKKMSFFSDFR